MTFNTTILLPANIEGRNAVRDMVWMEFDSIKVENEYSRQQMASRRQSRKGDLRAEAPIPWLPANMYHRVFSALVAGLVLTPVSSLLIPPSLLDLSVDALSPPSPTLTVTSELDCLSCPFPGTDAADIWQENVDSTIYLEFGVSNAGGLTVNGQPLLSPLSDVPPPFALTASQVRTSDGAVTRPLELSFVLVRFEPVFDPAKPEDVLLPIQFTIVGVDNKPVKVDTIAIDLFRTRDSLSIARLSYLPFETTPGAQTYSAVHSFEELDQQSPSQSPHGQRMHHHHHGRMHRFGRLVHHAIRYFFIPATLGIIGGLVASAVGMLLAQFIMYLWQIIFPSSPSPKGLSAMQVLIVEDEKIALMAEEESSEPDEEPPRYKDLEAQTVEAKH
ncbi:hypothetical protein DV735_g4863, partial [Chaetothyriales sp. CBS 134920]